MHKEPAKLKSVKIQESAYALLIAHAEKTKRTLQYLLTRAVERCYGKTEQP